MRSLANDHYEDRSAKCYCFRQQHEFQLKTHWSIWQKSKFESQNLQTFELISRKTWEDTERRASSCNQGRNVEFVCENIINLVVINQSLWTKQQPWYYFSFGAMRIQRSNYYFWKIKEINLVFHWIILLYPFTCKN